MNNYLVIFFCISMLTFGQKTESINKNCTLTKENNLLKKYNKMTEKDKNVLGTNLEIASLNPLTGFYRDGFCSTGSDDNGLHIIAAVMTDEFLNFSKNHGNDLITPNLEYGFPGLKSGDVWCLCAKRWKEALSAGLAPPVILKATNQKALKYFSLNDLKINDQH